MEKKRVIVQGSVIIDRLIKRKDFLENFEIEKKVLWESPMCNVWDDICPLSDTKADYIIIDLLAVTYQIGLWENKVYTFNTVFQKSEMYKNISAGIKIIPFDKILQIDWKKILQVYMYYLRRVFKPNQIILIKGKKSEYEVMGEFLRKTRNVYTDYNKKIQQVEDFFCKEMGCLQIDLCDKFFSVCDECGTNNGLNYEEEFFENIVIALKEILLNQGEKNVYCTPDYGLVLGRMIRHYAHLQRTNLWWLFLDDSNFVDHIVLNLGQEFIRKYMVDLQKLKDKDYNSYEQLFKEYDFGVCQEIGKAIRCIEAIEKHNYSISNMDYSMIFRNNMRLKWKMIPIIQSELKKEEILGDIVVNEKNIEVCFQYLNLFLHKQYRKAINYALSNRDILKKAQKVDIWGSCISREIYNLNSGVIELAKYLYRCCCLHAFEKKVDIDEKLFGDNNLFGSAWRKSIIENEIQRKAENILQNSNAEWIILDLYDIVENCYSFKGEQFILETFSRNSLFFKKIQSNIEKYSYLEQSEMFLKGRMNKFIQFLKKRYKNKIILNRFYKQKQFINFGEKIVDFKNDKTQINRQNLFIRKWEQYFIDQTNCYVIDIATKFLGDDKFVWGGSPVHYENCFFEESIKITEEIITTSPIKRYYNQYSYATRIERMIRLLPKNRGNKTLDVLFNDYYLDKIMLQLDVEIIKKYNYTIQEIYQRHYASAVEMLSDYNFKNADSEELQIEILKICNWLL